LALVLRKLDKKLWLDPRYSQKLGSLAADAVKNFRTSENSLSVFLVDDDSAHITRVLAAVVSMSERIREADYALFDISILSALGVNYEKEEGDTADAEVNKQHVNLVNLTAQQILMLAQRIQASGRIDRVTAPMIEKCLRNGIKNGRIQPNRLNKSIASALVD
jgi:hypothetical protein